MKVASFNVNSVRARLAVVVGWLLENRPDVLCLQETKAQDADFPAVEFEKISYRCAFKGEKGYNGVAILSTSPTGKVRFGFDEEPQDKPRLITGEFGGIAIVNTYVPQGHLPDSEKFAYKLEWFARLLEYFDGNFKATEPLLWVGDLNIAPEAIDVYDPESLAGHVCFHPDVHKALKKVMEWGFVDVFRKHCPEAGRYTFWDYRLRGAFKRNLGWRLDHIMATRPLADRTIACYIDKKPRTAERPSDHTPIVAEFDW
jgi:exodeoxyribonuclease-3